MKDLKEQPFQSDKLTYGLIEQKMFDKIYIFYKKTYIIM